MKSCVVMFDIMCKLQSDAYSAEFSSKKFCVWGFLLLDLKETTIIDHSTIIESSTLQCCKQYLVLTVVEFGQMKAYCWSRQTQGLFSEVSSIIDI